jgi:hypothetical protein
MTKYKTWQLVNQCKGSYFSWKNIDENGFHVFYIERGAISCQLTVKSFWKLLYYNDLYFESIDFDRASYTNLILNHSWDDLIITEVSIADNYELRFMLKGKMEFIIPVLARERFGYKGSLYPIWELKSKNTIIAASYHKEEL